MLLEKVNYGSVKTMAFSSPGWPFELSTSAQWHLVGLCILRLHVYDGNYRQWIKKVCHQGLRRNKLGCTLWCIGTFDLPTTNTFCFKKNLNLCFFVWCFRIQAPRLPHSFKQRQAGTFHLPGLHENNIQVGYAAARGLNNTKKIQGGNILFAAMIMKKLNGADSFVGVFNRLCSTHLGSARWRFK